jgi:hypothetical protein
MASLNAGAVVIVSAFALIVRSPIFGYFAQNGYCWRIQAEPLKFPKTGLFGNKPYYYLRSVGMRYLVFVPILLLASGFSQSEPKTCRSPSHSLGHEQFAVYRAHCRSLARMALMIW